MKPKHLVLALFAILIVAFAVIPGCSSGDDDDDDYDAGDDDDDDSGDDDSTPGNPPEIDHTPLGDQPSGFGGFPIRATITDDGTVAEATCFYRVNCAGDFLPLEMAASDDVYTVTIPDQESALVEYYLTATDDQDESGALPSDAPTTVFSFRALPATEMAEDDGTAEDGLRGIGVGSQVMRQVTPFLYPARLVRARFFVYADSESVGKSIRVNVYEDPASTGPDPDNLLWSSDPIEIEATDAFVEVDTTAIDLDFTSGALIVGVECLDDKGPWIGVDTETGYSGTSWYYDAVAGSFFNLADSEFAFNTMVRAVLIFP